jgi:polyadenylate-binding protein
MAESAKTQPSRKGLRTTLFVANLPDAPPANLEDALGALFAQHAPVVSCEVLCDEETRRSRGFGFVRLGAPEAAEAAKAALDGSRWIHEKLGAPPSTGGALKVRWALDTSTLYVADLAPSVTDDALRDAFRQFGDVLSCHVERYAPELGGHSKRFGFVEFSRPSVAAKARAPRRPLAGARPPRAPARRFAR